MSEVQLDLFNDTENFEAGLGDILHVWYTGGECPDLICTVLRTDGYGEVGFWVENGHWEGTLYRKGDDSLIKVHHRGTMIPVHKFEFFETDKEEDNDDISL